MVTEHSCTIFVPRRENGDIAYYRYHLPRVHFETLYGGGIGGGGISPDTNSMLYIPIAGYIPRRSWEDHPMPWTIFGGGQQNCKVVKGIFTGGFSDLKTVDAYTVRSVEVCDYGNPAMRHLEVALR